ncbi:MAG: ATP phosphoribosyltransferase [Thermoleophilia bacterium]|nr:ATP phosphoribosyltransferase [Thermoleophilia bacterium]
MTLPLRIAVPSKGRLASPTTQLLRDAGIAVPGDDRRLLVPVEEQGIEILLARTDDIPTLIRDGAADIGVAGCNQLLEHGSDGIETLVELGFGACRLVLAVPNASTITSSALLSGSRIATSHPNVLAAYLEANAIAASVVTLSGSIELAPTIGAADAICDLVSTGETLRQNSLRMIGEVMRSQAVLLARVQTTPDPRIAVLQTAVESVLAARPKRYLMLNAPDAALDAIIALLPGLDAPTILPLARTDMHAVHAVVDAAELPRLLHPLKEAGASGLLVLPIEHLIP